MYDGLKNLEVPKTQRKKRSGARKVLRVFLVGVFALGILGVALGAYTYNHVSGNLRDAVDHEIENLKDALPGQPLNVLVIGSDSREGLRKGDKAKGLGGPSGRRADVIMLVHVAAKGESATIVSLPRDLRVEIPGHGINKINAAYALDDGPNLMIRTVKRFTKLPIHHSIEVNFFGFRDLVNALGGVPLYINRAISDDKAKLEVPRAGCWILDGNEALAYVRARQFDPTADIGRIQRQQGFLRALGAKAKSLGVLLQPNKLINISEQVGEHFRYDKKLVAGTTFGRARAIAAALTETNPRKVEFRIVPHTTGTIGGISYVLHNEAQTRTLFNRIRNDKPLPDVGKTSASVPDREDVYVEVLNGSKKAGLAKNWTRKLDRRGFQMAPAGNTSRRSTTVILYDPGEELKGELVAKQFPGAKLRVAPVDLPRVDVRVKLGADYVPQFDEEGNRIDPTPAPAPEPSATTSPDRTCRELV